MATADPITPAILNYINHHAYPEKEDVSTANLGPDTLANVLEELHKAQNEAKDSIRSLSKDTAPDVDEWISRAKALQQDIVRSRDTARQIVAEHEAGRDLRARVKDKGEQARLLEKEVGFEETLAGTLEHIRYANGVLDGVQEAAVKGNVEQALDKLETAQESIDGLSGLRDTKACGLLQGRTKQLRESLAETVRGCWSGLVDVRFEEKRVVVKESVAVANVPKVEALRVAIRDVVKAAERLGILDALVQKLSRDLERSVVKPRLTITASDQVAKVEINGNGLSCSHTTDDTSYTTLFQDLEQLFDFLATRLPSSITVPLSRILIPNLSLRLEEQWLDPSVPLNVTEMPAFQETLDSVQYLAEQIDKHSWHGTKQLRDWVQSAPRTWLTKRREAVLGDARNLVFAGLRETKVVERIETQMVSKDDHQALGGGGGGEDDDWDAAWDEPEEEKAAEAETASAPAPAATTAAEDDDDGSAWDTEDADAKLSNEDNADDEGDAWGWGDGDNKPPTPVATKHREPAAPKTNGDPPTKPSEREMTLRETFTVTSVPDGILEVLQQIITDAQTLVGSEYASSPIAPAATAPTAYAKLPTGNMLIYNDASHLSSQLRSWQANQPPASRLRLDADVKALETFAKRAYSSEMDSQRTILRDFLDGAQGFSNVTKQPYKGECESAVEQTVDRLREVQRQWKPILSSGALLQSLGSLLATVTGKIINEIVDLGDIGEEDSHQLRHLMDLVTASKEVFTTQQSPGGGEQDMTFIYCPNWLKFQYLAEILESSLADIKYLWSEGELSLEFEGEEVVELIEGLFADSEIRRRTIGEIRRGVGRR